MASPHASSFICLPFTDTDSIVDAYTVYFSVCIGSALIGVLGALLFLAQVVRQGRDPYLGGAPNSQRCILILLAVSDLFADLGKSGEERQSDIMQSGEGAWEKEREERQLFANWSHDHYKFYS